MSLLIAAPLVVPLLSAALAIVVGRSRAAQRAIALTALSTVLGCSVALLVRVDRDGPVSTQGGGWPAPIGITLVVDRLAATMLVVGALMLLGVLAYAIGQGGAERQHVGFHPVYLCSRPACPARSSPATCSTSSSRSRSCSRRATS